MNENKWLSDYLERYRKTIFDAKAAEKIVLLKKLVLEANAGGKKIVIAGNGGSAAMASHVAVDFTKTAGIRAVNFNEADLITCFANDYGYEHWVEKAIEFYTDPGDLVILISSSGKSPNMVMAADFSRKRGLKLVTFTGFAKNNPLSTRGDLNFWVDSDNYNVVENTHLVWLLAVCDMIISSGKATEETAVTVGR